MSFTDQYLCNWDLPPRDPLFAAAPPCPFCASPRLSISRLGHYVHCDSCGADGPEVRMGRHDSRESRAHEAVRLWSARKALTPTAVSE